MKCSQIFNRLKQAGIPVAYSHFNEPPPVPFVVYIVTDSERYGADYKNMLKRQTIRIELYTDHKNEALEDRIANLFNEFEIDVTETYIEEQELYQVSFEFDMVDKLEEY